MPLSRLGLIRRVHLGWLHVGIIALVICAASVGSFFLTREFLSSGGKATADDPDSDPDLIAARRAEVDEFERLSAIDKMKPRFAGELGEYFFILDATAPFPAEFEPPPALWGRACREDTVPVTPADTELYVEAPARIEGTEITLSAPPAGQLCADQFVWVEQHGTVDTIFGLASGSVQVNRAHLYHNREALYFDAPRDRFVLTSIAGKPALLILPIGPTDFTHVHVIERPATAEQPGIVTSVGAELSTEQVVKLAEEVVQANR